MRRVVYTLLGMLGGATMAFAQIPYQQSSIEVIEDSATWQYWDDGSLPDVEWNTVTYDDSDWEAGAADFGFGDGDETTETATGVVTTYLRKQFSVHSPELVEAASLWLRYDEGLCVYLNGEEIYRDRLPAGAIDETTVATSGSDPATEPEWIEITLESSDLVDGYNYLAVESHLQSVSAADMSFNAKLLASVKAENFFEVENAPWLAFSDGDAGTTEDQWQYSDKLPVPDDDDDDWQVAGFDSPWSSGEAPLGYGHADVVTTVTESNMDGVYCFRRSFNLTESQLEQVRDLWLELRADDGIIVYLNGQEIARFNQAGAASDAPATATVTDRSLSLYYPSSKVTSWIHAAVDPHLVVGENVLSAVVTQAADDEADLIFDCQLKPVYGRAPDSYLGPDQRITGAQGELNINALTTDANDLLDLSWTDVDGDLFADQDGESPELMRHTELDALVEALDGDPLAMAAYVQNEIELTDYFRFGESEEAYLHSEAIHRGALGAYLEKQGSPYEQCALLVYLLRRSGHIAAYVEAEDGAMRFTTDQASRMLQLKLWGLTVGDEKMGAGDGVSVIQDLAYPWVAYYDEEASVWRHLFPWIKDTVIEQGFDLYQFMPEGYRSGREWVEAYLRNDPEINQYIGADGDDTAGNLFYRFVEEYLKPHGLSIDDMGMTVVNRRNRYEVWEDFPRPFAIGNKDNVDTPIDVNLARDYRSDSDRFITVKVSATKSGTEISSSLVGGDDRPIYMCEIYNRRLFVYYDYGPNRNDAVEIYLASFDSVLDDEISTGGFGASDDFRGKQYLRAPVAVEGPDSIKAKVQYIYDSANIFLEERTLVRDAIGAICIMRDRVTRAMLDIHARDFWRMELAEEEPTELEVAGNITYLLGMSYYERTMRDAQIISDLYNVRMNIAAVGVAKFTPESDTGNDWRYPGVDMPFSASRPFFNGTEFNGSIFPFPSETTADAILDFLFVWGAAASSHEHQVINDFFDQRHAISTVKLLRTANLSEQEQYGDPDSLEEPLALVYHDGFYSFSDSNFPEDSDTNYTALKNNAGSMWSSLKVIRGNAEGYVYLTPDNIKSLENPLEPAYDGMGGLLVFADADGSLLNFSALIANQANGGAGTAFQSNAFSSSNFNNLQLGWQSSGYRLSSSAGSLTSGASSMVSSNMSLWNSRSIFSSIDAGTNWFSSPSVNYLESATSFLGLSAPTIGTYENTWNNIVSAGLFDTATSSFINAYQSNSFLGDPVSITTGELYVDEVDLTLEGPLSLQLRRNYSSRNEAPGLFGFGWKMAFTPFISIPEQEDDPNTLDQDESNELVYIAELDGSTLAYRKDYTASPVLWRPTIDDNPNLSNYNGGSIGSTRNPYLNELSVETITEDTESRERYTLKRADGSIAIYETRFEDFSIGDGDDEISWNYPLLETWTDAFGNSLMFTYHESDAASVGYGHLDQIISSNGNFLTFSYSASGQITRVRSNDGREVSYEYSDEGDLISVTRPDASEISYEYEYTDIETRHFTFALDNINNLYKISELTHINFACVGDQSGMRVSNMRYWPEGLGVGESIELLFDPGSIATLYRDNSYRYVYSIGSYHVEELWPKELDGYCNVGDDAKSVTLSANTQAWVSLEFLNPIVPTTPGVVEFDVQLAGDVTQAGIIFDTDNELHYGDNIPASAGGSYNHGHYGDVYSSAKTRAGAIFTLSPDDNSTWLYHEHVYAQPYFIQDIVVDDRYFDYGPVDRGLSIEPTSTHLLTKVIRPDGRVLMNEYDDLYDPGDEDDDDTGPDVDYSDPKYRRVTKQYSTVGADLQLQPVNSFTYDTVTDANAVEYEVTYVDDLTRDPANPYRTTYVHKDGLMHYIADPLAVGFTVDNADIDHVVSFTWCEPDVNGDYAAGEYQRSVKSIRDKRGLVTSFTYDANGNVATATDTGEINGVSGDLTAVTQYFYNTRNLLLKSIAPAPGQASDNYNQVTYYEFPLESGGEDLATLYRDISDVGELTDLREYAYLPNAVHEYAVPAPATADDSQPSSSYRISTTSFLYGYEDDSVNEAHGLTKRVVFEGQANAAVDRSETMFFNSARGFLESQKQWVAGSDYLVSEFKHNAKGELYEATDPAGRVTKYRYDMMGRPTMEERLSPDSSVALGQYQYYNANGEVVWVDGPREDIDDFVFRDYDGDGRLIAEIVWRAEALDDGSGLQPVSGQDDFLGQAITYYEYDHFGNLTKVIDPLGNETTMEYDAIGRLLNTVYADGAEVEMVAYEPGGQPTEVDNELGGRSSVVYNSLGLPTLETAPDGQSVSTVYYQDGRPKQTNYQNGSYELYSYNDLALSVTVEHFSSTTERLGKVITWSDARGNAIKTRSYVDSGEVANVDYFEAISAYDGLGRPVSITGPPDYSLGGNLVSSQQTTTFEYEYDSLTQEYVEREITGSITVEQKQDYLGRPISSITKDGSVTQSIVEQSYSADHAWVETTRGSGQDLSVKVYTDTLGNPVLSKNSDGTFTINVYDKAGNLTSARDEYGTVAQKETRFTYDSRNRLASETRPDGSTTTFDYDAGGNLIKRQMPGDLIWSANYDSANRLDWELLQDGASGPVTNAKQFSYYSVGDFKGMLEEMTETADGSNVTHTSVYDEKYRLLTMTSDAVSSSYPDVSLTYAYDLLDRMTEVVREASPGGSKPSRVSMAYDGYGQQVEEKVELGIVNGGVFLASSTPISHLQQEWDFAGRRTGLVDLSSGVSNPLSSFTYRADNKLAGVSFGSAQVDYTYDDKGLPLTEELSVGGNTLTQLSLDDYDARGRLLQRTTHYAGSPVLQESVSGNGYSPDSKLLNYNVSRGSGGGLTWANLTENREYAYDADTRRLLSERYRPDAASKAHVTLQYGFDADGLGVRTSQSYANGSILSEVSSGGLNGFARVTGETLASPQAYQVEGSSTGPGDFTLLLSSDGTNYSEVGVVSPYPARGDGSWSYPLQFGLTASGGDTYYLKARGESVWNDNVVETAAWPLTVNNSVDESSIVYDEQGRVMSRTTGADVESFTWDATGRMNSWSSGGKSGYYTYDGLGRCIMEVVIDPSAEPIYSMTNVTTTYDPAVEFLAIGVTRTSGAQPDEAVWLLNGNDLDSGYGLAAGVGGRVAVIDASSGEVTPLIDDWFGNVVAHVNTSGTALASDDSLSWRTSSLLGYGPVGEVSAGGYVLDSPTFAESLHWQGRAPMGNGYFAMGARFYDPQSGRFLSPDPLGHAATPDLYSYAGGDPINGIDYDGRINRQTFDLQMSGLWQGPDFGSASFMDSWTKQLNDWHKEPEWMQPKMSGLDQLQNVLDYVGMIPVIGNVADGLNVVISTLRGNYADAAIRATFMAPGVGIGAAATYKVGKMSYRAMSGRWGAAARKAFTPRPIVDPIINRGGKARGMIYVPGLRFGQRTAKKVEIRGGGIWDESIDYIQWQKNNPELAKIRSEAVAEAWRQEALLAKYAPDKLTRNWTPAQIKELISTGKVKGFHGHHINSVSAHPELAGVADNIRFLTPAEHFAAHSRNWRNKTTGPLLTRAPWPKKK
ncbi:RHS repeat-associated core domain-containing protein [Cerasicoccus frondis]|uniref:RHS repeat-associated core domain-containing protein n=1 Tax=Cerasicoccus frondis TaxID=490090 RepID=UPI002852A248|nr:RHS repeat-associated core domain-containing protein [Cerasicoccus frondis]